MRPVAGRTCVIHGTGGNSPPRHFFRVRFALTRFFFSPMQIIDNKALEFVTKKHEQIRALIPRSTVLETRGEYARMLVAWGVD